MFRDKRPSHGNDWEHEFGKNRPSDRIERLESRMEQHYSNDMLRLASIRAWLAPILASLVAGVAYLLFR